jgi:hypothetical protein
MNRRDYASSKISVPARASDLALVDTRRARKRQRNRALKRKRQQVAAWVKKIPTCSTGSVVRTASHLGEHIIRVGSNKTDGSSN